MAKYLLERDNKAYTANGLLKLRLSELAIEVQNKLGVDSETAKLVLFEVLHKNMVMAEVLDMALFVHDKEKFYAEKG